MRSTGHADRDERRVGRRPSDSGWSRRSGRGRNRPGPSGLEHATLFHRSASRTSPRSNRSCDEGRWGRLRHRRSPPTTSHDWSSYYSGSPIDACASFVTRIWRLLRRTRPNPHPLDRRRRVDFVLEALAHLSPRSSSSSTTVSSAAGRAVSVRRPAFVRSRAHSNLSIDQPLLHAPRVGARLRADRRRWRSNTFFVRRELLPGTRAQERRSTPAIHSTFREGQRRVGRLFDTSGRGAAAEHAHLPLLDVVTNETLTVGDLLA